MAFLIRSKESQELAEMTRPYIEQHKKELQLKALIERKNALIQEGFAADYIFSRLDSQIDSLAYEIKLFQV